MKPLQPKAFCVFRLLLGLVVFAVAGTQGGGLRLVMQQIEVIGTRQWLGLVAGSFVLSTPVLAPVTQRIASALARRTPPLAANRSADAA